MSEKEKEQVREELPERWSAQRYTYEDGWCWFFGAIDHCVEDIVGWHMAKIGDRWAALEPIRQGVRTHLGGFVAKIALGLGLRHDWAPQYTARQFAAELRWLGIRSTPAYVGEPECNGIIEAYNNEWLIERHGHRTPAEVRRQLALQAA